MKLGKVVGVGNTAMVYEWDKDKVLKLFYSNYPKEFIENEFHNAITVKNMDFPKPKAYEIISYEDRIGIIYDRVEGESLQDWAIKTGDLKACAVYMANLHKAILHNKISNVPNYKDFLKFIAVNLPNGEEIFEMIDKLPDGDTLCHGDLHPNNILISHGHPMAIDFMNVCHGHFLYDVSRTVFLVEYTPVPMGAADRELLLKSKKALADLYLMEMKVTREMIQDFLSVIRAVRAGECPKEESGAR